MDVSVELVSLIREIRDTLTLLAEPAIAKRDENLRSELRNIVGSSSLKRKAVLEMNSTATQAQIVDKTGIQKSHLSTLVKQLGESGLLAGDLKHPALSIKIPASFFEKGIPE